MCHLGVDAMEPTPQARQTREVGGEELTLTQTAAIVAVLSTPLKRSHL